VSAGPAVEQGRVPRTRTGRDRPHLFRGRPRAVNARFTDDEYAELATAADNAGLTPTGFCAQAALDAARNLHTNPTERIGRQSLGSLQAELFQVRTTVNQFRAELNCALAVHDSAAAALGQAFAAAAGSLVCLDEVISRIHRLLNKRHRREGHM
jgi:hypothetical protein